MESPKKRRFINDDDDDEDEEETANNNIPSETYERVNEEIASEGSEVESNPDAFIDEEVS